MRSAELQLCKGKLQIILLLYLPLRSLLQLLLLRYNYVRENKMLCVYIKNNSTQRIHFGSWLITREKWKPI